MTLHARATRWVALFCVGLFPLACRQGDDGPLTPVPIPFHLTFSPGDSYQYDAWLIDPYGYPSSTTFHAVQRVLNAGGTSAGLTGVATILDSTIVLRDTTDPVQQFSVGQSADGDVYRFGLVADIARMLKLPAPPKRWDRIAGFSLGFGQTWVAGYLDSTQLGVVYGEFSGVGEQFSVKVNGVQSIFTGYRINLYGPGVDYNFWIADSPSGFLRTVLQPGDVTYGAEFDLTETRRAAP
jgi:hypothetical protein